MQNSEYEMIAKKKAAEFGLEIFPAIDGYHKFYFIHPITNRKISFGSYNHEDFIMHGDEKRRELYRKRHKKIMNKKLNKPAYLVKYSPAWASYYILW